MLSFADKSSLLRKGYSQVVVVGFVCFCLPGIYNALNGMGGAGKKDPTVANLTAQSLQAVSAITSFISGALFNWWGPKVLLVFGGLMYPLYTVFQWLTVHDPFWNTWAIVSGGFLGWGAGLLWTAQGAVMLAYAPESKKGMYISTFWLIFNLGGCIGGILTFALNYNNVGGNANDVTYFSLTAIMVVGALLPLALLAKPTNVVREDGKPVEFQAAKGVWEAVMMVATLFGNLKAMLILPLAFSANWYYTYQFTCVNAFLFNSRTRGLNSAIYWGAQMAGSVILGRLILDKSNLTRKQRAWRGMLFLFIFFNITWAFGLHYQFVWGGEYKTDVSPNIDWLDGWSYVHPLLIYICYGLGDSMVQVYTYWLMGALTNRLDMASRFVAWYKTWQGIGAMLAPLVDTQGTSYDWQIIICVIIFNAVLVPAAFVVKDLKETSDEDDDVAVGESTIKLDEVKA